MTTLSTLKRAAAKICATVEDDKCGDTHECRVQAPAGHVFKDTGLHEHVDCSFIPWKPDYQDLIDRMSAGVERCSDLECDWCHPET